MTSYTAIMVHSLEQLLLGKSHIVLVYSYRGYFTTHNVRRKENGVSVDWLSRSSFNNVFPVVMLELCNVVCSKDVYTGKLCSYIAVIEKVNSPCIG